MTMAAPYLATLDRTIQKVRRQWARKGATGTALAVLETVLRPLIRRRRRMVFGVSLAEPRPASEWGPSETLLIYGPHNIGELSEELTRSVRPDEHREDFDGIRQGNHLFVVAHGTDCLYRSYACTVERPGLRHSVFFGELLGLPELRSAEVTRHIRPEVARGMLKGIHARVLNEQLRCLRALGYPRAVLYIMAENVLSIRATEAAGFQLFRSLTDWIVCGRLVLQRVDEHGSVRWRLFWD
jgi:hypothetical protein